MTQRKEQRKYVRYQKSVPVRFSDVRRTIGKTINVSREGALIELSDGKVKAVSGFVKFRIYIDGLLPDEEKTTPKIDIVKLQKAVHEVQERKQTGQNAVKIVGQVVRHEEREDGKLYHGINFLELDGDDMVRWLEFVGSVKKEVEVTRVSTKADQVETPPHALAQKPGYTIRFKQIKTVKNFLPSDVKELIFIPTPVERDKNSVVSLSMIHPANKSLLQFDLMVESYGQDKKKEDRSGIYCSFCDFDESLKHQINMFIGGEEPHYK